MPLNKRQQKYMADKKVIVNDCKIFQSGYAEAR